MAGPCVSELLRTAPCLRKLFLTFPPIRRWNHLMPISPLQSSALLLTLFLETLVPLAADDWPVWRGPNRNGIVAETSGWSEDGWVDSEPKWRATVHEGSGSPLVVDGHVYVTGWNDGNDVLQCLQADSGKVLWTVSQPCPRFGRLALGDQGLYGGPTSTPEYDPQTQLIYTLSCDGDLYCRNTKEQGSTIWKLNLHERYRVQQRPRVGRSGHRDYGYTSAPLIRGELLLVEVGAASGTIIAFDRRTGEEVWKSAATDPAGHTGGLVPLTVDGVPCVATLTFQGLLVTRLDGQLAGQTVASFDWVTSFANNVASPAVYQQSVLITSAYNQNAMVRLDISLQGIQEIWRQPFASKVCTPVIRNGYVYWAWQQFRCLDFETGEQQWAGGRWGDAGSCIATADDRLIVWGGRGSLAVIDSATRSPDALIEHNRTAPIFTSDVWPHVTLADQHLYCRDRQGQLVCFQIGR